MTFFVSHIFFSFVGIQYSFRLPHPVNASLRNSVNEIGSDFLYNNYLYCPGKRFKPKYPISTLQYIHKSMCVCTCMCIFVCALCKKVALGVFTPQK